MRELIEIASRGGGITVHVFWSLILSYRVGGRNLSLFIVVYRLALRIAPILSATFRVARREERKGEKESERDASQLHLLLA